MLPFAPLMMHVSVPITDTAVQTSTCQLCSLQHALMQQFRATVAGLIMVLSHSNTVTHMQFEVTRVTSHACQSFWHCTWGLCRLFGCSAIEYAQRTKQDQHSFPVEYPL